MINRQRGYTLIELGFVLLIMGTMTLYGFESTQKDIHQTMMERVAQDGVSILQAAEGYFIDQDPELVNRWPSDIDALVTNGYLPNTINPSLLGTDYVINNKGAFLELSIETDSSLEAELIAARLPMGDVSGVQARGSITRPGAEMMHQTFYLHDGTRALSGNMEANGHDILNAAFMSADAMRTDNLLITSDLREKKGFRPIEKDEAERLLNIPIQAWQLNSQPNITRYGPTAQDIQAAYPDLVSTSPTGVLAVNLQGIQGLVIENLQRQHKQIQKLILECGG